MTEIEYHKMATGLFLMCAKGQKHLMLEGRSNEYFRMKTVWPFHKKKLEKQLEYVRFLGLGKDLPKTNKEVAETWLNFSKDIF